MLSYIEGPVYASIMNGYASNFLSFFHGTTGGYTIFNIKDNAIDGDQNDVEHGWPNVSKEFGFPDAAVVMLCSTMNMEKLHCKDKRYFF